MHPLVPVFVHLTFLVLRFVVHGIRDIVWWMNGTRAELSLTTHRDRYSRYAQLLDVVGRHKYDMSAQGSTLRDFILLHNAFVRPEYVLRDELSLYHVDRHHAVFVECRPGIDVWDPSRYSFSRQCQHQEAIRVVVLPIHAAHGLAAALGKPYCKLIFMGNISRCGSTLLCHMFHATGEVVAHSEPGAVSDLVELSSVKDEEYSRKHAETTVTLLCKPVRARPRVQTHVVKVMSGTTEILGLLAKCFPDARFIFMYRDHMTSMLSLARLLPTLPYANLQITLRLLSVTLARMHAVHEKFHRADNDWPMDTDNAQAISVVLQATVTYYQLRRTGVDIRCFRYEDVVERPIETLKVLFKACGVSSKDVQPAMGCLKTDSQEKSAMNRKLAATLTSPTFTEKDIAFIRQQCKRYSIPDVLECNRLDGNL